jgi:hypothetical protein
MTRNMFKLSHRNSFWESCYLWQCEFQNIFAENTQWFGIPQKSASCLCLFIEEE